MNQTDSRPRDPVRDRRLRSSAKKQNTLRVALDCGRHWATATTTRWALNLPFACSARLRPPAPPRRHADQRAAHLHSSDPLSFSGLPSCRCPCRCCSIQFSFDQTDRKKHDGMALEYTRKYGAAKRRRATFESVN